MSPENKKQRHWRQLLLRGTGIALLVAVLVLVVGTAIFANQAQRILDDTSRRLELSVRLRQLRAIEVALLSAETGQRGYFLTGRTEYLKPYSDAIAQLPDLIKALDDIPLKDPSAGRHAAEARNAVLLKIGELEQTLALAQAGDRAGAMGRILTDIGMTHMDRARSELERLVGLIAADRDAVAGAIEAGTRKTRWIAIVLVGLVAACAVLAVAQVVGLRASQRKYERELAASEQQHRAIVEDQQELISLATSDGRLTYVNPAYGRHVGRPASELIGTSLFDLITPEDADGVRRHLEEVLRTGGPGKGINRMVAPGGGAKWFAWTNSVQTDPNGRCLLHSVGRDITERKLAERALEESRQALELETASLASVIEAFPAMVAVFDEHGRYRMVNGAFERLRRLTRAQLLGKTIAEAFGDAAYERVRSHVEAALRGEAASWEADWLTPDRRVFNITMIPLRRQHGASQGFVSMAVDITAHRDEARRLLDASQRDPLTGLLNRSGFQQRLAIEVNEGRAESLAVLFVDLDRFKPINDTYGHAAGDELLCAFGTRVQRLIRPSDAVARIGGDEFAIMLVGVRETDHARLVAQKIVDAARMPFQLHDGPIVQVGASVGVAVDAGGPEGWEGLVKRADVAVYEAKGAGRGRIA